MLFSNEKIANFINSNFEPSWESVRPVPRVTIDFGNGNIINRTLHGNIATYVCNADGNVLDVLPGVYDAENFLKQLNGLLSLSEFCGKQDFDKSRLLDYHKLAGGLIEHLNGPHRDGAIQPPSVGEVALKFLGMKVQSQDVGALSQNLNSIATYDSPSKVETSMAENLKKDTQLNETDRREKIHQYLSENNELKLVKPSELKTWLYREVLHADLDDPYMGLSDALFGSYPFAEEDAEPAK